MRKICSDKRDHFIPRSLGGILECRFLCADCNSKFGTGFEATARLAPELRKAASQLEEIPELKEELERGAAYVSQFGKEAFKQKLRKDGHVGAGRLNDGSLIVPERDAAGHIANIMRRRGVAGPQIENALTRWEVAPAASEVDLGSGLSIRKWQQHPATPTYTEPPLSALLPLKIAYEFAALLLGDAIYHSGLQHIRKVLLGQDEDLAGKLVAYNWASKPDAFHGVAFEGNHNVAQFQVRFFGLLAYTVRFPKVAIEHPPAVYTHRLDTGKDWAHLPHSNGQKPDGNSHLLGNDAPE